MNSKYFLPAIALLCILWACGNKKTKTSGDPYKDSLITVITNYEKQTAPGKNNGSPENTSGDLLKSYMDFFHKYSNDSLAPAYLFKAAQLSIFMHYYMPALDYLRLFQEMYPKHRLTDDATFLTAFIYDNHMHDVEKAKKAYENFIAAYPNSPLVNDAKASISNLGLSDEELIRKFEQQNGMVKK
ncbi:MAG: tetratricopeptide repeat protein [Bacteroidota bacterium]|jgi:TolA-binding protein